MSSNWMLERDGFELHGSAWSPARNDSIGKLLTNLVESDDPGSGQARTDPYGVRNILQAPAVLELITLCSPALEVIQQYLRPCFAVRGIYFDKPFRSNWSVPWHQDTTIAVSRRVEGPNLKGWTEKAGVPHVRAPVQILQSMVTLRIHLDDANLNNGALLVIPGSHARGILTRQERRELISEKPFVRCDMSSGSFMLMRPLILHSSHSSESNMRRRVLHIEFCAEELPGKLEWYDHVLFASPRNAV